MTLYDKRQDEINRELEEEKADLIVPIAEYSLHITALGKEKRFIMKEPYFSILATLVDQERHPVMPEDIISVVKAPFTKRGQVLEALKQLVNKGYIRAEKF